MDVQANTTSFITATHDTLMFTMPSKSILKYRLKLKLSSLLKYSKKLKQTEDDLEEYVDFSWKFTTKQATKHESLTAALATLPAYDVVDTWMSSLDLNPCDQSQCQCET